MDLHDAAEQRVELAPALERRALGVVDRVLAAEHEDEEQLGEGARGAHDGAGAEPLEPPEPPDREAAAVHELVEHERVLPLLDHLVVGVAELGRIARQRERQLEEPALERVLEQRAGLHLRSDRVEADPCARRRRLAAVPVGSAEGVLGGVLETRVVGIEPRLGGVPGDVGVGIEVLGDRLAREPPHQVSVGLARGGRALLVGDGICGRQHGSSPMRDPGAGCVPAAPRETACAYRGLARSPSRDPAGGRLGCASLDTWHRLCGRGDAHGTPRIRTVVSARLRRFTLTSSAASASSARALTMPPASTARSPGRRPTSTPTSARAVASSPQRTTSPSSGRRGSPSMPAGSVLNALTTRAPVRRRSSSSPTEPAPGTGATVATPWTKASGTIASITSLPASRGPAAARSSSRPSNGTARTSRSTRSIASTFWQPSTCAPGRAAAIRRAASRARAAIRDPMSTASPAAASRSASPEPRAPVPPRSAIIDTA